MIVVEPQPDHPQDTTNLEKSQNILSLASRFSFLMCYVKKMIIYINRQGRISGEAPADIGWPESAADQRVVHAFHCSSRLTSLHLQSPFRNVSDVEEIRNHPIWRRIIRESDNQCPIGLAIPSCTHGCWHGQPHIRQETIDTFLEMYTTVSSMHYLGV